MYNKEWYEANKERIKSQQKAYYEKNKENIVRFLKRFGKR